MKIENLSGELGPGRGELYCRVCESRELFVGLDLGLSPIANSLDVKEDQEVEKFPLRLRICSECGLGQLGEFQPREKIFSGSYPYRSSTSQTWIDDNRRFAHQMVEMLQLGPSDQVIELASNDGYLLREFKNLEVGTLGVEPASNVANLARDEGITTISEFFGLGLSQQIRQEFGESKLIVAKNVLAHVPDIHDFVSGIAHLMSGSTCLVIETPTILQILDGLQFDTIYHEHFSYLSLQTLGELFSRYDIEMVGVEYLESHGGSIRVFLRKMSSAWYPSLSMQETLKSAIVLEAESRLTSESSWRLLQDKVDENLQQFRDWLLEKDGKTIIAFGAAAKGVTYLNAAQVNSDQILAVVDNSEDKIGRYLPGTGIPIIGENELDSLSIGQKCTFLILPWNIAPELSRRIAELSPESEVFVAVPSLRQLK